MAEVDDAHTTQQASALDALLDPPEHADAGLFVIHGAGAHAPSSTLHELLNPTLSRMREEGNVVAIRPFKIGTDAIPGGCMEGLVVDFISDGEPLGLDHRPPKPPSAQEAEDVAARARHLMVVEARWNDAFLKTRPRDVSFWAALHVGRMMWEVLLYHYRSVLACAVSLVSLGLIIAGFWFNESVLSVGLTFGGLAVAFTGGLFDTLVPWSAREERLAPDAKGHVRAVSILPAALSYSVYHVQRGFVIIVAAFAIVALPFVSLAFRFIATLPGLDAISLGTLAAIERMLVGGPPSDVETISNNPTAASVIQSRLRAGLMELEERLPAGATVTVVGHSAGGPLAYWLLSEPAIHLRQHTKHLNYRLITVGAALNWAKRGMDTIATPLYWPLVNADGKRTTWLNMYSLWDPAPHGPVREDEYAPGWASWPQTRGGTDWLEERDKSLRAAALRRLRRAWAFGCPDPPLRMDNNPNLAVRNLGSPVSAEHSEYFRNQQEFVPALVRSIDENIAWAAADASPLRHRQWTNARIALLSGLTRVRMFMLALPVGTLIATITGNRVLTSLECAKGSDEGCGATLDSGIESPPGLSFMADWTSRLREFMRDDLPWNGFANRHIWMEDILVIAMMVLVMYALVDLYTNACWSVLGRRVRSLAADDGGRWPPARWTLGGVQLLSGLIVWVPTLIPPLFLFALNAGSGWWLIALANTLAAAMECFWFGRGIRALRSPDPYRFPEFLLGSQRHGSYLI